jgi:hypothetical protein
MLSCVHCDEPIERAQGVWYHPHRRFRGNGGTLPVLCDFGDRLGPTHATPIALTPNDKDFLHSLHVSTDDESFVLEALWSEWQHTNVHQGPSACADCGAAPRGQHSLSCERRAPMIFEVGSRHQKHVIRH